MKKIILTSLFGWLVLASICSQSITEFGSLQKANISYRLSNKMKAVHSAEFRSFFYEQNQWNYRYALSDLFSAVSIKTGASHKLNIGYTLRISGDQLIHRATQQFSMVRSKYNYRLGHRWTLDQTFEPEEEPLFRIRYRWLVEKPLIGDRIDRKEVYLKAGNEYLIGITSAETDLEGRGLLSLGMEWTKTSKIEFGLDYRINGFVLDRTRHRFFATVNYYESF